MAPFPETEIMTIKRLEVALRKMDFKLLKDGAYKLHEKYHSGHRFEYLDLLKDIYKEVSENHSIPADIKDILIPTIEDILSPMQEATYEEEHFEAPKGAQTPVQMAAEIAAHSQDDDSSRISSLTSLSYEVAQKPQEKKISAFSVFSASKNEDKPAAPQQVQAQSFAQSPYSAQPFREFQQEAPHQEKVQEKTEQVTSMQVEKNDEIQTNTIHIQNSIQNQVQNSQPEAIQTKSQVQVLQQQTQQVQNVQVQQSHQQQQTLPQCPQIQHVQPQQNLNTIQSPIQASIQNSIQSRQIQEAEQEEIQQEKEVEIKSIAIFFGQDSSAEKTKNILKYRDEVLKTQDRHISVNEYLELVKEITTQSNTNVSELKSFLEQLKTRQNKVNLITNSQSSNFIDLFDSNDITYSIFNPQNDKRINLLPLFGLTNMFKCSNCNYEYLDTNDEMTPFMIQCPHCKAAMFPDFYASTGTNCEINMDYYNSSVIALANSNIWLLIRPSLNEKITMNMLRSALKVSNQVQEIYILDKDINIRETYKSLFLDINEEIKINTQISAIEDFFNSIN